MSGKKSSRLISDDYHNSKLTVKQIAQKHGVCIRTVYNTIKGKADRKGLAKQPRRYLSLTRNEAIFLIDAIRQIDRIDLSRSGIEDRLKNIIEDLPQ